MSNTIQPDKLYLNLSSEEFKGIELPKELVELFDSDDRLIINWVEGDGVIPDYRLLLTKRIKSLKPMIGTAPWGWDVLDARVNLTGDKSMAPCITHITTEDLDK